MKKILILKNLLLVGLSDDFVRLFSSILSDRIDFYYLDVESLLNYSIMDRLKMEEICGVKYLEEQERKIIREINDYERTVISMKLDLFIANIKNLLSNNIIIYLKLEKDQISNLNEYLKSNSMNEVVLNDLLFDERDKYLKKNCDIILNCDINDIDKSIDNLIQSLSDYCERK